MSEWHRLPFDKGLLGTGATLAARLRTSVSRIEYITNVHVGDQVRVYRFFPVTGGWEMFTVSDRGNDKFPYGYLTDPDW